MSVSRNIFSSDTPLISYRDELFKSDETLMAHAESKPPTFRTSKTPIGNQPRSARIFQFGGDDSGDCRKMSSTDGMRNFCSARSTYERKDIGLSDPIVNRYGHIDRHQLKRSPGSNFGNENESAEVECPLRSTLLNSSISNGAMKGKPIQLRHSNTPYEDGGNSETDNNDVSNDWDQSKCSLKSSTFAIDEPNVKSAEFSIEMDYIVLLGLVIGVMFSKASKYLNHYIHWVLNQMIFVRNALFGQNALADLLNMEDSNRLSMRNKIILLPVVAFCSLIYGLVTLLNRFIQLLLRRVPHKLTSLVTKWHSD